MNNSTSPNDPIESQSADREHCRARALNEEFAHCLVEKPTHCPYILSFGYGFLCRHPDQRSVVAGRLRLLKPRDHTDCKPTNDFDKQLGGKA